MDTSYPADLSLDVFYYHAKFDCPVPLYSLYEHFSRLKSGKTGKIGQCVRFLITCAPFSTYSQTRLAEIELSTKVCTSAERVRDTLLHEVCHAAVWIFEGINDGHGPRWRYWSWKAQQVWPRLPIVSVCHAYAIDTRFTYRCTGCGACVNRHSKSVNTEKQVSVWLLNAHLPAGFGIVDPDFRPIVEYFYLID